MLLNAANAIFTSETKEAIFSLAAEMAENFIPVAFCVGAIFGVYTFMLIELIAIRVKNKISKKKESELNSKSDKESK